MHVSILIPCYNAESWVANAIESALAQTWPDKEVIVLDDGSTDNSLHVIKSFGNRIRWETGPNRGSNSARNRLLELSSGEWLQYLDADDYLLKNKVAQQMDFIARQPDADVIFGPVMLEYTMASDSRLELIPIPEPYDEWVLLARWYLPQTGAALWRKQAIVEVGGWKQSQPCCQEHELYLRLLMTGKRFAYCAHSGAVYRQWSEHTLCKHDTPRVHRHRLEIEQRAEEFLSEQGDLTAERLAAINQARFETARMVWVYDPGFAREIVAVMRRSQSGFLPGGLAGPWHYRFAYRLFGFEGAEKLAALKRLILARANRHPARESSGRNFDE